MRINDWSIAIELILSKHAKEQIADRGIPERVVRNVVKAPEQQYNNDIDETVCQSKKIFEDKVYLVRVYVNFYKEPPVIISAYRTSKIEKYWRSE